MRLLRFHHPSNFRMGLYMCTGCYATSPFSRPLLNEETSHYSRAVDVRRGWYDHCFAFASWTQVAKWIWSADDLERIMDECTLSEIIVPAGHFFANERQAIFEPRAVISKRFVPLEEALDLFNEAKWMVRRLNPYTEDYNA